MTIQGTSEGVEAALDLVNYLVGPECAQEYGGVLAGRYQRMVRIS
jgi:hypothetical protein